MNLSRKKTEFKIASGPIIVPRLWPPLWNRSPSLPSSSSSTQDDWKEALLEEEEEGSDDMGRMSPPAKGTLAVYVGPNRRRVVIPTACLAFPDFQVLMAESAEEFGFQQGALHLPCPEARFYTILTNCLPPNSSFTYPSSSP